MPDIRWKQRLENYKRALGTLERGAALAAERELTELERQGLIQGFEFTHELAWNVLKDYLEFLGFADFHGSKDTVRLAFRENIIENGETWMAMIRSRNLSSHTYNIETAEELTRSILGSYIGEFLLLAEKMTHIAERD